MTATPNQPKCLYWLLVLATIFLLMSSPKTVDSTPIVAGSILSQHALGVDQRDARVKRNLRSDSDRTQNIDTDQEDRGLPGIWRDAVKKVQGAFSTSKKPKENTDEFTAWVNSVNEDTKNLDAKMAALLGKYTKDGVVKMLADGEKVHRTKVLATNLKVALVKVWEKNDEHADDVFALLSYGDFGISILKNPILSIWIHNAEIAGKKPYMMLLAKLVERYEGEELAKLLAKARNDVFTQKIVTELDKVSIIDMFNHFKLNKGDQASLLVSPMLSPWITFAKMRGKNPYELLFLAMKKHVNDLVLARILAAAKKCNDANAETVKKLQTLQLEAWQKAQKSGRDIFKLLKLNRKDNKRFQISLWDTWVSYMKMLNPNDKEHIMLVLKENLSTDVLAKLAAYAETTTSL